MKTFVLCVFLPFLCGSFFCDAKYIYQELYIDVPLDHFSYANNLTFKLRYLSNQTYWRPDGPLFFYTGNEGDIEIFAQNTGFMWEIAEEFGALLVFAEHRYYGKSLPFGNQSYSDIKYLGYLTSPQALADYVYLIDYVQTAKQKETSSRNKIPVIAFGGSYGGMLAAWIRMKYPGYVQGAIASSAPILQFTGITPCDSFDHVVTQVFKISNRNGDCTALIKRSWQTIRKITETDAGKKWLSENWKLCKPLQTAGDVRSLIEWLEDVYGNIAMINYPYPTNFLAPVPANPVRHVCEALQDETLTGKSLTLAIINALSVYTNYTGTNKCIQLDLASAAISDKGWDFQSCTEIVMPMCANDRDMFEPHSWNYTQYVQKCYQDWKVKPKRYDTAVLEYGGKNLRYYSNIVFSNGLLDPWSAGGVLENISKTIRAVLIPEGAHHLDLRASNRRDPYSVRQARAIHKASIHRWIAEFYQRQHDYYWGM